MSASKGLERVCKMVEIAARPRRRPRGSREYRAGRMARVMVWMRAPRVRRVGRVKESFMMNYKR